MEVWGIVFVRAKLVATENKLPSFSGFADGSQPLPSAKSFLHLVATLSDCHVGDTARRVWRQS